MISYTQGEMNVLPKKNYYDYITMTSMNEKNMRVLIQTKKQLLITLLISLE